MTPPFARKGGGLGGYLRDFRALLDRYDHRSAALYGHFGDACAHTHPPTS